MVTNLRKLKRPISDDQIKSHISKNLLLNDNLSLSTLYTIDLSEFEKTWRKLVKSNGKVSPNTDKEICIELHKAIHHIPRRETLNPLVWIWLAMNPLRDYVVSRWVDDVEGLTPANLGRFNCVSTNASLGSTNALSRLYWASDVVFKSSGGSYEKIPAVIGIADLHKTLFTNSLALDGKLLVATCVALSKDYHELVSREVIKTLGAIRMTTMYASMSDTELEILIQDIRTRVEMRFSP